MPAVDAYRRAPLVDPAFVPLSDAAVQLGGLHGTLTRQVLDMADIAAMSPLDAVMASKLGGYADLPPLPDLEAALSQLQANPGGFIRLGRAALITASATQNKDAMVQLLSAMHAFLDALPTLPEDAVFALGADALRLTSDLYRRTGQAFLLTLLERLRAQLPDVSGLMHSFPFLKPFQPETRAAGESAEYHQRMERMATGNLTADALAITAYLALYSGSSRDGAAGKAGLTALARYHGMPTGAFSADPYLAGRDPSRAADIPAICAQIEVLCDLLAASGDLSYADRLESLMVNCLPDMIAAAGVRGLQPINRLADDDSCAVQKPQTLETSALLRALYALRRTAWMAQEEDAVAMLLPLSGGCLTRVRGIPVRLSATASGAFDQTITLAVEARQPVDFTLQLRIPSYVSVASVSVNGGREQGAQPGMLFTVQRTFRTGDTITLRLESQPRLEMGARGSVSCMCGPTLLALPLPNSTAAWRFALVPGTALTPSQEGDELRVTAIACEAPSWEEKSGFVAPPPQGVPAGPEYALTLLPFAKTAGRIAAFPQAVKR